MIKIESLRIGNKLMYGDSVIAIDSDSGVLVATTKDYASINMELNIHKISPIVLNEEYLKKTSFTKVDNDNAYFLPYKRKGEDNATGALMLTNEPAMGWIISIGRHDDIVSINAIEFVHELQNMVYMITGEELNIQ